jgi:Fur family transcriptional regulator, ferric uptake regulator
MNIGANHQFEEFVRQHHGRLTPQRQFIAKEFLSLDGHYDIQELHDLFRKKGMEINPSTIFRTLKLLVQAGFAIERHFANGNTKYDVNVAHHDHLICLNCGKIVEFDSPRLEKVQAEVVKKLGFEMSYHRHEIYGRCPECRHGRANLDPKVRGL